MIRCLMTFALIIAGVSGHAAEVAGDAVTDEPVTVRHDVARAGDPVVTLRYFRIRKGTFDAFLEASESGVWPFFEKIGARVVGMWQVIHPADVGETASEPNAQYDEVWLMTRYASVEHWRATRRMAELGGNGPDYEEALEALRERRSLTVHTDLQFLRGSTWQNPPQYLPAVE